MSAIRNDLVDRNVGYANYFNRDVVSASSTITSQELLDREAAKEWLLTSEPDLSQAHIDAAWFATPSAGARSLMDADISKHDRPNLAVLAVTGESPTIEEAGVQTRKVGTIDVLRGTEAIVEYQFVSGSDNTGDWVVSDTITPRNPNWVDPSNVKNAIN